MLNFILSWGPLRYVLSGVVVALTALLAIFGYGVAQKRKGVVEASAEALRKDTEKREKANEAAFREKKNVSGISDRDLVDRLRRRSDDWGSL